MLAMPGLINTHAHVPMVLFRGMAEDIPLDRWFNDYIWPLESNLEPEDVYWGMLLGLMEMIEAGVTSVADHYFYMDRAAEAVEKVGTRALLGWTMFGHQGQSALEATASFLRQYQGTAQGRIRTILAPHAPYTCDENFLRLTAQTAQQLGVGIHIHVAETKEQTQASLQRWGLTPIKILEQAGVLDVPTILAHACGATPSDLEILSRYPVGIAHTPKTYLKLAMDIAPVAEFRQAGLPVGLGTDGAVSNNRLDIWESLRLMSLMQKYTQQTPEILSIAEALYVATVESARVFGMGEQLGKIAPQYLADLILIDLSGIHHQPNANIPANLLYSIQPSDVQSAIVNGQIVMRERQILTVDKAEVIYRVNQRLVRLHQRQPVARI